MNFNEVFKVRAVKRDEKDTYVITIGDRLTSTEEFQTAKQAQMKINKKDSRRQNRQRNSYTSDA